ncbi:MAG: nucleotidyltransferase domain-containing protein [Thermoplasmata archaeon]|nr:nucleotidyltransferase domain-containing protein [Thermoplasmata archaeon]
MLQRLFTSKTRVKLLTLFLMNPEREMYVREIARKIDENINAVRRELANLEEIGLLKSEYRGNSRYYMVNKDCPIYEELTSIFMKYEGVAGILKENLTELGKIDVAFIYGSFAKGGAGADSDIDLFLIGVVDEDLLAMKIMEIEKNLSREVNYVLFTPDEFRKRIEDRDPFVINVMKEPKIMLIGEIDVRRP